MSLYVLLYIGSLGTATAFAVLAWWNQPRRLDDGAGVYEESVRCWVSGSGVHRASPPFDAERLLIAAAVLWANWLATHIAWQSSDPILFHAIADTAAAAWFVLWGRARWELIIGALFLASVFAGVLTALGAIIPDALERMPGLIAWSHPDILAALGHVANAVLGFTAWRGGRKIRRGSVQVSDSRTGAGTRAAARLAIGSFAKPTRSRTGSAR